MQPTLNSNSKASCLYLPSAGMRGMCHCALLDYLLKFPVEALLSVTSGVDLGVCVRAVCAPKAEEILQGGCLAKQSRRWPKGER